MNFLFSVQRSESEFSLLGPVFRESEFSLLSPVFRVNFLSSVQCPQRVNFLSSVQCPESEYVKVVLASVSPVLFEDGAETSKY